MTTAICADGDAMAANEMLRRVQRGDQGAFNVLFERHFEPLTRFVARMVDSRHVAAELVQDVFLRVWSGRRTLDVRGDFRGYLRRAARNRALDWLRREDLHRAWEAAAVHEASASSAETAAAEETMAQLQQVLADSLAAMPARRRAVCELRWRAGLGPSAIAERLGVSVKTVESHVARGLADMRSEFLKRVS